MYYDAFKYRHCDNQEYNLVTVTPPASEPVSYQDLADHLRLDQTDDEAYVTSLGIAAREYVEKWCKLTLATTTYTVQFDVLANHGMRLPRRPVSAVTGVTYLDQAGTQQTLDSSKFVVDRKGIWTTVRPIYGTAFPFTTFNPNGTSITFTAGTDVSAVPELAKLAIKELVSLWYENREAATFNKTPNELPFGLRSILLMLGAPGV